MNFQSISTPKAKTKRGIRPFIPGSKIQIPSPPKKVAPLVRRVMSLMTECERVDSMPDSQDRSEALQILLDRIGWFEEDVTNPAKNVAIEDATVVLQAKPN
jgi:hypothetical protein